MFGGFGGLFGRPGPKLGPVTTPEIPVQKKVQKPLGVIQGPLQPIQQPQAPLGVIQGQTQASAPPEALETIQRGQELEAVWNSIIHGWSGYAKASRELLKRVATYGPIRFAEDAYWDPSDKTADHVALYEFHRKVPVSPKAPRVTFLPPKPEEKTGYRIIYTMMETERIHPDMVKLMNERYEECWVPTRWNAGTFKKSGLELPTYVMPLGVDPSVYSPRVAPFLPKATLMTGPNAGRQEIPKGFLFINVFQPSFRKGHDALVKVFEETFSGDSDVGLILGTTAYSLQDQFPWESMGSRIWTLPGGFSERQMASIYKACQAYITTSRGEGWGLPVCFLPNEKVDTPEGPIKISEASGRVTFDHMGVQAKISGITKRMHSGTVVSLRRFGDDEPIVVTAGHRHFGVICSKLKFSERRRLVEGGLLKPSWIEAESFLRGDLVCIPKLEKPSTKEQKNIVVDKYVPEVVVENGLATLKGSYEKTAASVSLKDVAKKLGVGFKHVSKILNHLGKNGLKKRYSAEHVSKVLAVASSMGYTRPPPLGIPKVIKLSNELGFLFGLYIAEGCPRSSNRGLELCFHRSEKHAIDLCVRQFKSSFGLKTTVSYKENKANVRVCSTVIGRLFHSLFGVGASRVHIPVSWKNTQWVRNVVSGIFYGDGTFASKRFSFFTVSQRLAHDILEVLNKFGVCGLLQRDRRSKNTNTGYVLTVPQEHEVRFSKEFNPLKYDSHCSPCKNPRYNRIIEDGRYFYVPIRSATRRHYNGLVYNLHVEGNHSLTVRGMATHNCEAGAVGLPVIVPRHSSFPELVPQGCGYFFESDSVCTYPDSEQVSLWFGDGITFPDYGKKSRKQIGALMRKVQKNYSTAQGVAQKYQLYATRELTWSIAAKKIADRLKQICQKG